MKTKLLNLLLLVVSLFGYLEWGTDNSSFLYQAELEILYKMVKDPIAIVHPFTILPMTGQLLLLITLFQKNPGKILTYSGMACIGILLLFMFFIGLVGIHLKIILSTIPFLVVAIVAIRHNRRYKPVKTVNG